MTTQALPQRRRRARSRSAAIPAPVHRPRLRPLVVFVVAVLIAFFGMIYSRISLDQTAFELQELDNQIAEQQELMDQLRVDAARLQDPALIADRAADMGLVYPEELNPHFMDDPATMEQVQRGLRADLRALRSAQP